VIGDVLLADNQMVLVISVDVTSAFDTISHGCILKRLRNIGVCGTAIEWVKSYLQNRKMRVKVKEVVSCEYDLDCGVPQGSVLGPILFNICLAELAELLDMTGLKYHIYADDVIVYSGFNSGNIGKVFTEMQSVLHTVDNWMLNNNLMLSPSKTSGHVLHTKRTQVPHLPELVLNGLIVNVSAEEPLRWLGVNFDVHLSMELFVSSVCKGAFHQLRVIRNIRSSLDEQSALLLCNSLVVSRLLYCNSLLTTVTDLLMNKVQRVWNLAARTVKQIARYEHISPIMTQLGWCSARQRCIMKVARLCYLSLHSKTPPYLNCIERVSDSRLRRHSVGEILLEPMANSSKKILAGAWEVMSVSVWNALPAALRKRDVRTLSSFENEVLRLYIT
jgi:hypothetical protein